MQQLFHPESQQPSFPSPSVGVAEAWSHCWTYLEMECDRKMDARGGRVCWLMLITPAGRGKEGDMAVRGSGKRDQN